LFADLLDEILAPTVDVLVVDQRVLLLELALLSHSGIWTDYQSLKSISTKNIHWQCLDHQYVLF